MPNVCVAGYALFPAEIAARAQSQSLSIAVFAELDTGRVVQVESSMPRNLGKQYVEELLAGVSLDDPADDLLETFNRTFWCAGKKTVEAALRDLYRNWHEMRAAVGPGRGREGKRLRVANR